LFLRNNITDCDKFLASFAKIEPQELINRYEYNFKDILKLESDTGLETKI